MNIIITDNQTPMLKNIEITITNKITMKELLSQALNMFNDIFYKEGIPLQLSHEVNYYSIKPSKKSGKPDNDLPSKTKVLINL
jgi:hypothetical protein